MSELNGLYNVLRLLHVSRFKNNFPQNEKVRAKSQCNVIYGFSHRCLEIGNKLLTNYYKNLPPYNKLTGLTEMTVAKICNSLNLLNEAELHIQKAEQILRDHSQTTLTSKVEGIGIANANDTTYILT